MFFPVLPVTSAFLLCFKLYYNSFSPPSALLHLKQLLSFTSFLSVIIPFVSLMPFRSTVYYCFLIVIVHSLLNTGCHGGVYQRKLYRDLMVNYNRLERPVQNDSAPIVVELGLTLLQIIDVVSV